MRRRDLTFSLLFLLLFFNKYVEVLFFSQEKQSQTIQFQDKKQHLTVKTHCCL